MSEHHRKSPESSNRAEHVFQEALQKIREWRKRDRNQGAMDEILPGLYVGGLRAVTDQRLVKESQIQAAVSVLTTEINNCRVPEKMRLQIYLDDLPNAPLEQYFSEAVRFIHSHRMEGRNVLVHCLMGVSRSVSIVIAYLITVTELQLEQALEFVRSRRFFANPNFGFRQQLKHYQKHTRDAERKELEAKYGQRFTELHKRDSDAIAGERRGSLANTSSSSSKTFIN